MLCLATPDKSTYSYRGRKPLTADAPVSMAPDINTMTLRTSVLIAGGGPAGLILAIELGRRGVPAILLEDDPGPLDFPKANATTSRTMEHYRRLGFAQEIRALGLPQDYPQDIAYFTRYSKHELARVHWPSRAEAAASREDAHSRWPTPEPLHRTQQMYIEPVLKRQAERWPSLELRFGWRLVSLESSAGGVSAVAEQLATGKRETLRADYLAGCDGARSTVREALGVRYGGRSGEARDFMGGRMLAVYFRSPEFYREIGAGRAWQYWAMSRGCRGLLIAIDGERFVYHAQLPEGVKGSDTLGLEWLFRSVGREFPLELHGSAEWTAGFALVADRYSDAHNRVFLVGDAAHLFTPTGGQGYNTTVDDAANLGWKLAAACQGWGGPGLLASYEAERKPIGHRNTGFARAMADSIGRIPVAEDIEADTPQGAQARAAIGPLLVRHCNTEFDIPGIHFGVFYGSSAIVQGDGTPPPVDDWHLYTPNATPGARAPHLWIDEGVSIFDRFGRDFSLLRLGASAAADANAFADAAARRGMPLAVVNAPSSEARDLYGRDWILIRPDHHIAWRGDALPADAGALLGQVTGHP